MLDHTKYENKFEYPEQISKTTCPFCNGKLILIDKYCPYCGKQINEEIDKIKENYKKECSKYNKEGRRLYNLFKKDLLDEYCLTNHPKADSIFSYCWDRGHSGGYYEVECIIMDLSKLFVDYKGEFI